MNIHSWKRKPKTAVLYIYCQYSKKQPFVLKSAKKEKRKKTKQGRVCIQNHIYPLLWYHDLRQNLVATLVLTKMLNTASVNIFKFYSFIIVGKVLIVKW